MEFFSLPLSLSHSVSLSFSGTPTTVLQDLSVGGGWRGTRRRGDRAVGARFGQWYRWYLDSVVSLVKRIARGSRSVSRQKILTRGDRSDKGSGSHVVFFFFSL